MAGLAQSVQCSKEGSGMITRMLFFMMVCLTLLAHSASAQYAEIGEGNREYEKGRFRNAEDAYRKALAKDPRQYAAGNNLGSALYRQGKSEESAQQYLSAATLEKNPAAQARSYYNMGNALMKGEKWQESVEAYKKALKLNPADEDARYNLSYALKKLKQQQQNQDNKQDKKEQQKNDQQKQKQDQQKQKEQQQEKQQQQQKQPKMTKEEAERMLKALKNDEKDLQKEKAKKFQSNNSNPEKNW